MTSLPANILPRVGALIRLCASPLDGEALGAVRALDRTLKSAGSSFDALAEQVAHQPGFMPRWAQEPPPNVSPAWGNSSRNVVKIVLQRAIDDGHVTPWERDFAASIIGQLAASWSWKPTPRQETRLDALLGKLHSAGVRA